MIIDHLYDSERDIHWYHLGFYNEPIYSKFYEWLHCTKLHYTHADMPHDYWAFLNEADRFEMHKRFDPFIAPMEHAACWFDASHDMTVPIDTTSESYFIMQCLRDAIAEEINKEIMASASRNP